VVTCRATDDVDVSGASRLRTGPSPTAEGALLILMPETLRGLWRQRLRWARAVHRRYRSHAPCSGAARSGWCRHGSITS
jgi:hypothetical protein